MNLEPTPFVRFAVILGFSLIVASTGCRRPSQPAADTVPDTLATMIAAVEDEGFRLAYERIGGFDYTRYTRTEQFDGDDFMLAYRERITRVSRSGTGTRVETVSEDSAGSFRFGFFNRFVSQNTSDLDPVDLAPFVLSEDPPYMRARNRAKYEIRSLPDTLLWDTQARVIEIRARPDLGDGENIRRVRYYVNRNDNELVAMYLERIDLALLFREESRFYVHVRPAGGGVLLPYNSRFDTRIRTPFRKDHRFRTVSTYYGFGAPPPRDSAPTPADSTAAGDAETPESEG